MQNLFNKKPKILVVGDVILDCYLRGSCDRISPEAPVQVLDIKEETDVLGGACNVANNLKYLGADVSLISVIGDDEVGRLLKDLLEQRQIPSTLITQPKRNTSRKNRLIANNQQIIRYDQENCQDIDNECEQLVFKAFTTEINQWDLIILSDYNKGVLTQALTQKIIQLSKKYNKKVLVDPKGIDYSKYRGAYLLTPNKKEVALATGITIEDEKSLVLALQKLKSLCQLDISLITLSEDGVAIFDKDFYQEPTVTKEVYDVTGAGDTVIASLGFSLACRQDIYQSLKFANLAAGVVVGKFGSMCATLNEISEYESSLNKSIGSDHIKSVEQIIQITQRFKAKEKRIVFTNGCFDILHIGHLKYLEKARSFGDILIVGVNSDSSVKRLKGEKRPINSQDDRAYILGAFECVDYVVLFDEDTPYNLIRTIAPDILVKGADYQGKEVVGQDLVKELKLVDFVEGKSTTKIIQKVQKGK